MYQNCRNLSPFSRRRRDSNLGTPQYQAHALPTELSWFVSVNLNLIIRVRIFIIDCFGTNITDMVCWTMTKLCLLFKWWYDWQSNIFSGHKYHLNHSLLVCIQMPFFIWESVTCILTLESWCIPLVTKYHTPKPRQAEPSLVHTWCSSMSWVDNNLCSC